MDDVGTESLTRRDNKCRHLLEGEGLPCPSDRELTVSQATYNDIRMAL